MRVSKDAQTPLSFLPRLEAYLEIKHVKKASCNDDYDARTRGSLKFERKSTQAQ